MFTLILTNPKVTAMKPIELLDNTVIDPTTIREATTYYCTDKDRIVAALSQLFPKVFNWDNIERSNYVFDYYNPFKGVRTKFKIKQYLKHHVLVAYPITMAAETSTTPEPGTPLTMADSTGLIFTVKSNVDDAKLWITVTEEHDEWEIYRNDELIVNNAGVNTVDAVITHSYGSYKIHTPLVNDVTDEYKVRSIAKRVMLRTDFSALIGDQDINVLAFDVTNRATFQMPNGTLQVPEVLPAHITDMSYMFAGCVNFNQDISMWDTSRVTDLSNTFADCVNFNQPIGSWNVGKVTTLNNTFRTCTSFGQDLSGWDTGSVVDMSSTFYGTTSPLLTGIGAWDISSVTNMTSMFGKSSVASNIDLSTWDMSNVTSVALMFDGAIGFNQDISMWDVSSVTSFYGVFKDCISFNQPLETWDISAATSLIQMFKGATAFNQPLNGLDISKITILTDMFNGARSFNQDLSAWDTSNVTHMGSMFQQAVAFDQDISMWDTNKVTNMFGMFNMYNSVSVFNQDLSLWCVPLIPNLPGSFALNTPQWTLPKPIWGTCPRHEDGSIPAEPESEFGESGLAADYSGSGWYLATDTGTVYCKGVPNLTTRIFSEGGIEYIAVADRIDAKKYRERSATSNVTDMQAMAFLDGDFNFDMSTWDTSNVTNMNGMFARVETFNQDISMWNVGKVTNMMNMFSGAFRFNQDISGWDVSNVAIMDNMLENATDFNQDLSLWCVSSITSEPAVFSDGATSWTLPKPVWGTCPRGEDGIPAL